ncbi:hypothetical protein [Streptomyces sp. CLCI03]
MNALTLDAFYPDQTPILTASGAHSESPFGFIDSLKRAARPILILGAFAVTASMPATPAEVISRAISTRFPVTRTGLGDEIEPLLPFVSDRASVRLASEASTHSAAADKNRRAAERALVAVGELSSWLNLPEERIAELGGFSRRSTSNWRAGGGVYPKTVRGLFEIHSVVKSVVSGMGLGAALLWLQQPNVSGECSRLEELASEKGRRSISAEIQTLILSPVPVVERASFEPESNEYSQPAKPVLFNDPPKSRRPRPA